MFIEITKKEIVDALIWVSRVLASKVVIPAVSSIQIVANDDDSITFKATNIDAYTTSVRNAKVKKQGEAIVLGRVLLEIVRLLPEEKIQLKVENNKLTIKTSKTEHNIPLIVTELQNTSFDNFKKIANVNTEEFIHLLNQVSIAVAREDSVPILTTVNLLIKKNALEATTIDRYRVAKKTMDIINFANKDFEIPVKHKNLSSIINGVEHTKQIELYYYEKNNQFGVIAENDRISFSLISGDFPNTENLFRNDYKVSIILNRKALLEAVNRTSILTEATLGIFFSFEKNKLTIWSESEAISSKEEMECEYNGENLKVKFNSSYIKDGITQIEEEFLLCKIDEVTKPVKLIGYNKETQKESENYEYVIVPIRET